MNTVLFMLFSLCSMTVSCAEFLYPIAPYIDSDHSQKMLVLHQKGTNTLELWSWDVVTHAAVKMVSSSFCPAGVALLPQGKGFSFIDNGRIRIKEFIKRSPRSIDIPYGVSALGPIRWHDNGLGYFHALRNGHYALFSITVEGDIECCLAKAKTDCMYPSWFKEKLFYIERIDKKYRIVEQLPASDNSDPLRAQCIDFCDQPLIFLVMNNDDEGFFLQHPPKIDISSSCVVTFSYHRFACHKNKKWHTERLFSFSIPSTLLDNGSENRLYESMLPLVPRVYGSCAYYVDTHESGESGLSLYKWDIRNGKKELVVSPYNSLYLFSPILLNSMLFCGGSVSQGAPHMPAAAYAYIHSDNTYCFSLPCVSATKAEKPY